MPYYKQYRSYSKQTVTICIFQEMKHNRKEAKGDSGSDHSHKRPLAVAYAVKMTTYELLCWVHEWTKDNVHRLKASVFTSVQIRDSNIEKKGLLKRSFSPEKVTNHRNANSRPQGRWEGQKEVVGLYSVWNHRTSKERNKGIFIQCHISIRLGLKPHKQSMGHAFMIWNLGEFCITHFKNSLYTFKHAPAHTHTHSHTNMTSFVKSYRMTEKNTRPK